MCATARAREVFGPFDPRGDGVTVTAMIEWGKVDGVPEDVCREVYDSATAMNWTNKGSPITDARAWLRYCNTYRKSHTTTQSNATHRTNTSSPPSRRDRGKEVYASARANRAKLYGLDDPNAAVPGGAVPGADEYGIPVAGDG